MHFALQLLQPRDDAPLPLPRRSNDDPLVRLKVGEGALPVLRCVGGKNDSVLVHGYNVGVADAVLVLWCALSRRA